MDAISMKDVKGLIHAGTGPRVSIYAPMQEKGIHVRQNRIQYKTLLTRARKELEKRNISTGNADGYLSKAAERLDDTLFWEHQGKGLAVFLAENVYREYRLPRPFQPDVIAGDSFYVTPLIPLCQENICFYILSLNQGKVRLFKATPWSIREEKVPGMPQDISEVLQFDNPEENIQWHTGSPGRSGNKRPPLFHGHGSGFDESDKRTLRFVHQVNKAVHQHLNPANAPMVVAAVESVVPIYENVNTYPHLMDTAITRNPEDIPPNNLLAQALTIVQPYFDRSRKQKLLEYGNLSSRPGKTASKPEEVVAAAIDGQIDTLFLAENQHLWGQVQSEPSSRVLIHQTRKDEEEELLNLSAIHTLNSDGTVYIIKEREMPSDSSVAAIFRYPAVHA